LHRQVNKPRFTPSERFWLALLASRVHHWKEVLIILKPDTPLRWHRLGFQLIWKFKSRSRGGRPKLAPDTISLIQMMAKESSLWGGERIHGELLKLNIELASSTTKKYLRQFRANNSPSQT
jgi:putative transposase